MRLHEFVPVADQDYGGESLIDRAFGPGFCVVDECGRSLTTFHNRNLLRRARMIVAHAGSLAAADFAAALEDLRGSAETLTQDHYDRAVARENAEAAFGPIHDLGPFDHSHIAGSLE